MKWSLQQLHKYNGQLFNFETSFDFKNEIEDIDDIYDISEVKVKGSGQLVFNDRFEFTLHIQCTLVLQDARTLDPVDFPIDLTVDETFDVDANGDEDVRIIEKNTIDLKEVVWENILLEKPIRFVKDESPSELD